ncbi:MAG TPA: hypothetical protein VMV54_09155, partial [Acidocella sp.]|nr:hypothetical protein [Acidocella sp.]
VVAAILLFSRGPSRLLRPELWAEDGVFWLRQAYNSGLSDLMTPIVGYLQTLSRLGGLVAIHFPLTEAPLIFALIAFVVQLAPVVLLLSRRGEALVPSLPVRLLIVLYYIGAPNSFEVYVNLTNAMWHLALVAFLLVVLPKPRTVVGLIADAVVLMVAGLSGPLVLFIAPIAWWQVVELRRQTDGAKRLLYASLLTLCAVVQGMLVAAQAAQTRVGHLGASFSRLVHILADQIFLGGVIGGNNVLRLLGDRLWLQVWPAALVCVLAIVLGLIAFYKGPTAHRQLVVLSVLIMAGALKSPMVSAVIPQWEPMQYPGVGGRYYIIPMLAWFTTLLVLATVRWRFGLQWVARGLVLCCAVGVVYDWHYTPYVHTGYHSAAKMFDRAPPGTVVTFPENPVPWHFELTKR